MVISRKTTVASILGILCGEFALWMENKMRSFSVSYLEIRSSLLYMPPGIDLIEGLLQEKHDGAGEESHENPSFMTQNIKVANW